MSQPRRSVPDMDRTPFGYTLLTRIRDGINDSRTLHPDDRVTTGVIAGFIDNGWVIAYPITNPASRLVTHYVNPTLTLRGTRLLQRVEDHPLTHPDLELDVLAATHIRHTPTDVANATTLPLNTVLTTITKLITLGHIHTDSQPLTADTKIRLSATGWLLIPR